MSDLDGPVFDAPVRPDLLHAVVVAQQAQRRRGTHATKNRALVSGGGAKPYRQKGTGRARQGTIRAPQMQGGGIAFGPQPRPYTHKVPKKVRAAALRSALALRKSEGKAQVIEPIALAEPKTKLLVQHLKGLGVDDALIVTGERDTALERAGRNLPRVRVLPVAGLNVLDVLAREHLLLTADAVAALQARLVPGGQA